MGRIGSILVAALALAGPANAQDGRHAAAELERICRADAAQMWGASLCGPLLLVDPATRAVWASEPDRAGLLTPAGTGWTGSLPQGVGIANTSLDWAGVRWIMLQRPLPDDEVELGVLLAHEAWHRIQPDIGFPASEAANAHLATERGRVLMRLEMRALATALRSRGRGERRAMRDALVLRAARQAAFPGARLQEAALERNEGLASYTGVRLGAGDSALDYALRTLDGFDDRASLVRSFAQATGPAYGLLLDRVRPGWRSELGPSAPADALFATVRPPAASAREVARASERYGGGRVSAEERERAQAETGRLGALRRAYAGPRLELSLANPQFEFNPNQVTPIEGLGAHYQTLTLRDAWGELRADTGALLSDDFRLAIAPAPAANGLSGPGWRLTLAEGWAVAAEDGVWRLAPASNRPGPARE